MKAFRNAYATTTILSRNAFQINPKINSISLLTPKPFSKPPPFLPLSRNAPFRLFTTTHSITPQMDDGPSIGSQFETFRAHLDESSSLRDRIKNVAMEIDSAARIMHANLLLVHQSRPLSEVLERANTQIGVIKEHFNRLAAIVKESPGQYYRYHNDWKSETQTVVSLLTFMHWLDTGILLMHHEAQEKLGLNSPDFSLDIEDYLVGVCFMSNELPRYVVNRVTQGDYDCPSKVLNFLTDLHASFRMLNLRNDFLRKKFDGMKYDLKRVEEVYYDVKIRGLVDKVDSKVDEGAQAKP